MSLPFPSPGACKCCWRHCGPQSAAASCKSACLRLKRIECQYNLGPFEHFISAASTLLQLGSAVTHPRSLKPLLFPWMQLLAVRLQCQILTAIPRDSYIQHNIAATLCLQVPLSLSALSLAATPFQPTAVTTMNMAAAEVSVRFEAQNGSREFCLAPLFEDWLMWLPAGTKCFVAVPLQFLQECL